MSKPVLRFAPSPNGHLHLGHAYSALYTAFWAERMGGRFLLRIEDTDIVRSKPEFTKAIFDDLTWLGLSWEQPVWHQSARFDTYAAHAERLKQLDLLYPCFCSRSDIALEAEGTDPDGAPIYPGTCRHLDPVRVQERLAAGEAANWRLRTDVAMERIGILPYSVAAPNPTDRPQIRYAEPSLWGDVVLQRKGTPTSYHLSVVIDDDAQGVTHVTRGRDMQPSTDIHVLLQMVLGLHSPIYNFHRLLLGDDGRKLSKSKGSPSLRSLKAEGWTPDDVRRAVGF